MADRSFLSEMPLEIIQHIFLNLCDVRSVVNLAQTSKQFRDSLNSPQYKGSKKKIEIFRTVIERQYGPLPELLQLATLGTLEKPLRPHQVPAFTTDFLKTDFLKTLTLFGGVVEKLADMYPRMRWRNAFDVEYRRQLEPRERERFRRAMYRWWIYNKAFHSLTVPAISIWPSVPRDRDTRFVYLDQFRDAEIVELCEVHDIMEGMLYEICPDDATIQKLYKEGFPDSEPLYFGTYESHRGHPSPRGGRKDHRHVMVAESWGDTNKRSWFVDDLLKLDLSRLLYFCNNLYGKRDRKTYTDSLGSNFYDNPGSFRRHLQVLANERDLMVNMIERGVGGGILREVGTAEPSATEANDKSGEELPFTNGTGSPIASWADGGSDSIPSDFEESELEDDPVAFEPYISDDEKSEGLFQYGEEINGSIGSCLWANDNEDEVSEPYGL